MTATKTDEAAARAAIAFAAHGISVGEPPHRMANDAVAFARAAMALRAAALKGRKDEGLLLKLRPIADRYRCVLVVALDVPHGMTIGLTPAPAANMQALFIC